MIDILNKEELERIIDEINSPKNLQRKRNEYINFEIGESGLKGYVMQKIAEMYPKTHSMFTIPDYSLVKKIRNKKAKSYKQAPVRKLDIPSEETDYSDILKIGRYGDAMKEIDKIYNQHNYAAMFIELAEDKKRIKFYPLRPYEFDIIKDDNGEVVCLILSYPGTQVTKGSADKVIAGDTADEDSHKVVYSFWTSDSHLVVEVTHNRKNKIKQMDFQELPDNPGYVNPFGIIPFAYLPYDFNEDYPSSSALPGQTIEFNSMLATYLSSANMQIGQLVISHPTDQPIDTVSQGMMTAIRLPQSKNPDDKPSTAQYISPAPNLSGHREAIVTFLSLILDENDINSDQVVNGSAEKFTSALDRMISQADVQHIIEDNQESYTRFEQECFNVINAMSLGYFKSTTVTTIYVKPKLLTSDTEKLANIKQKMEMGMIEDYEKLIMDNPNLTVEEAKEKLARINEERRIEREELASINKKQDNQIIDPGQAA